MRRPIGSIILPAIFILALFVGQACEPAFKPLASDSLPSTTSYLPEDVKAECGPNVDRPPSSFQTIEDLVAYLNELPRPLKLHCFIAQLPRPLAIQAGISASSAQPSPGERNPRVVIQVGSLLLAIVSDGIAKNTLEIGAIKTASQATRAEFIFPITDGPTQVGAGIDHIRFGGGTACGLCHRGEASETAENFGGSYRSDLIRFSPSDRRSPASVKVLADECVQTHDRSDRCLLLRALLEGEAPTELEF